MDEWGMGINILRFIRMGMNNILVQIIHPHSSAYVDFQQKFQPSKNIKNVCCTTKNEFRINCALTTKWV